MRQIITQLKNLQRKEESNMFENDEKILKYKEKDEEMVMLKNRHS